MSRSAYARERARRVAIVTRYGSDLARVAHALASAAPEGYPWRGLGAVVDALLDGHREWMRWVVVGTRQATKRERERGATTVILTRPATGEDDEVTP